MLSSKAFKINFRGKIDTAGGGGFDIQKIVNTAKNTSKHADLDDLIEPTPLRQSSEETTHREELQTHEDYSGKLEVKSQSRKHYQA
jgi:hypothetical protein